MPTRSTPPRPELFLSVQCSSASPHWPVDRAQLRRWVRAALERDAAITLRLVGAAEGRRLNRDYRHKDYATNVLTFAYSGEAGARGARSSKAREPLRSDIVLCLPVLAREAREQNKTLRDHLAHLVVHGVLHAQGWDHERAGDARRMEAHEARILRRFGIDDPYR